jgi:hypothetical protein
MSRPTHRPHRGRPRLLAVAAAGLTCLAAPGLASASPVDLGTVKPFVALAGATATNTDPSVLNGALGVFPGTALVGFGLPAVVNGATHATDGVAAQAQADLTTAYDVAAAQPVAPADDLTGVDLGGLALTAGAYRYTSSAQLTGALVLDAQGDPNAQFVFEIATSLTTASASSVLLVNGASPCNVYWQVGSSATLGSTTAFKGNLMALSSISLDANATVIGRVLARNGQVSLIDNVLDASGCGAATTSGTTDTTDAANAAAAAAAAAALTGSAPAPSGPAARTTPARRATPTAAASRNGTATLRRTTRSSCADGFTATVRGHLIRRVAFTLDGRPLATVGHAPFRTAVRATPGAHHVRARITFTDATRTKTVSMPYRACAAALRNPAIGPSRFTG